MRAFCTLALLAGLATASSAAEPVTDGPVVGGSFGMDGSDYYGDVRNRMPFTQDAPPRPIGMADIARARAARRRAEPAVRRAEARHALARRRSPHG
jgi:hypothetical protein